MWVRFSLILYCQSTHKGFGVWCFRIIMGWVKTEHVKCIGFPAHLLRHLQYAMATESVEWIPGTSTYKADRGIGRFEWAQCIWEIGEISEQIFRVTLISGDVLNEDLTAAVLRG